MSPSATTPPADRPPFWWRCSIATGNSIQLTEILAGAGCLLLASSTRGSGMGRVTLMVAGFLLVYLGSHAISHWAVGRALGLQFVGYGLRGTDHPESYPPGLRQLMARAPFFTAISRRRSREEASRRTRALYYAAGETSTTVFSIAAGLEAWARGIPDGGTLLMFALIWSAAATVATARTPRGDYAKAWRALHDTGVNRQLKQTS